MDSKKLKASLIFIFATFGTFLTSRYVTKNYGKKLHDEYGESALATGLATGAVYSAKNISNPEVGLGVIAGSGMNAAWTIASIPKIKEKLPQDIQATLGNESSSLNGSSLDDFSDEELFGNERVINIARHWADEEKEAYVNALMAAAQNRQTPKMIEEVGSSLSEFQSGLEGEEDEFVNSLD